MPEAGSSTPADGRRDREEQFAGELRRLRAAAGNPSFRAMAGKAGTVSHTTLHEAAKGVRFPSWLTTRAFVEVCGGDVDEWRARWYEASGAGEAEQADQAGEAGEAGAADGPGEDTIEMPGADDDRVRRSPRAYAVVGAACGVLLIVGGTAVYMRQEQQSRPGTRSTAAADTPPPGPVFPGDRSVFVRDVTIPDGTAVKVGERFVKTWEIKNAGTVPWHDRFLLRADLPADNGTCSTPGKVRIPDTAPGRNVRIAVPVVAPSRPGSCWVGWKMVDGRGQQFLPGARPIYFVVNVAG
ncbi:NBR1-Ig-like domain-containing protein [Actinomadura sp. GTD37]|uniref:NBR1-Ig-like domain-containing protein n=1 Tax=Actinomadura sp. GTD37 TaxID=1778030 RepID=UPI0035C076F0